MLKFAPRYHPALRTLKYLLHIFASLTLLSNLFFILTFLHNPLTAANTTGKISIYPVTCTTAAGTLFFAPSTGNTALTFTNRAGNPTMRVDTTTPAEGTFNHGPLDFNFPRASTYLAGREL